MPAMMKFWTPAPIQSAARLHTSAEARSSAPMRQHTPSRRDMLKTSAGAAVGTISSPAQSRRAGSDRGQPGPDCGRAKGGGGRVLHCDGDPRRRRPSPGRSKPRYPGIAVHVKRSGAERVFQRIGKEEEIRIHEVDVVCSTDAGHFVRWKREGLLAPYLPEDAAQHCPPSRSIRRHLCNGLRPAQPDRLQYQFGQARGRAQELR